MTSTATNPRIDAALAVLRVVAGVVFIAHGAQKLLMLGVAGTAAGFEQAGVPLPVVTAPLIILVELLGGAALLLGVLTRVASVGLAVSMLGAILFVHVGSGFYLPTGYEFALTMFGISVTLALAGAGGFSLDAVLAGRRIQSTAEAPVEARAARAA